MFVEMGGSIHSKMFSNFNHCNLFPQPSKSSSESMVAQRAAVGQLVELGHSVFHKFGRLQVKKIMRMVVRMMRSLAGCRHGHSPQIRVAFVILSACRTRGCASCDCDEEDDDGGDGNDDEMQDEWVCILPIVIHRILTQYQDIQNYKKVNLHHLIYNGSSDPPTLTSLFIHQL